MKKIKKPGSYKISFDDYLADPCPKPSLSRSTIKTLCDRTPRHAFYGHPRLNPNLERKESARFDLGTVAHALFLEGLDRAVVIDAADWRSKKAQEERDAARADGFIPMLPDQYADAVAMVEAAHEALFEWDGFGLKISDGDPELTCVWQEENGVWCRIRPDWISNDRTLCLDFKTTESSADPMKYNRIASDTGLDIQDAFYRRGCRTVNGTEPGFVFMVQEISKPFLCSFFEMDMLTRDMGEDKVRRSIRVWGDCLKSNEWPGYGSMTQTMEAPPWALAAWEVKKSYYSAGRGNDEARI
jgi:hypothetical protein